MSSSVLRIARQALRFLGAGAVNTGATLLIYQGLLFFIDPISAYTITWMIGLGFVVLFYPGAVFRTAATPLQRLMVAGIYGVGFAIGLIVLRLTILFLEGPRFAILMALVATTIFNFAAMRLVLTSGRHDSR